MIIVVSFRASCPWWGREVEEVDLTESQLLQEKTAGYASFGATGREMLDTSQLLDSFGRWHVLGKSRTALT